VSARPPELLAHDLGEEISLSAPSATASTQAASRVLLRGLRLKAGVDCGEASSGVNPTTGRIAYRGRLMNRAARIAGKAASGQVWLMNQAVHIAGKAGAPNELVGGSMDATATHRPFLPVSFMESS
jgi:class 3 adenylate cyclase